MKKLLILIFVFLSFNFCTSIPQRTEVDFRNNLENAIVETFPNKVVVVIHPFENQSPGNTNISYLDSALPDSLEALLEPLRSTIAYIPFDGMPFYVSEKISNLLQEIDSNVSNTNDSTTTDDTNEYYFSYLTNYLLTVPTTETQINYMLTTNTNYLEITTNLAFANGVEITNYVSNEILLTTTNSVETNEIIVDKKLLTPTNMLIMIAEEFPNLTNHLPFLPIEIRRATEEDSSELSNLQLQINNPRAWKQELIESGYIIETNYTDEITNDITNQITNITTNTSPPIQYPNERFEYRYHLTGDFRSIGNNSILRPISVRVNLQIYPVQSTGNTWWEKEYKSPPPYLSGILRQVFSFSTNNLSLFTTAQLRTPYEKPPITPRLQEEFDIVSTNFRDTKPPIPKETVTPRTRALNLRFRADESQIPQEINRWLKVLFATIINRPYTPLRVTTEPAGSLVYLNDFYIGTTPLVYPTAPVGEQRIRFVQDGFKTEEILTEIRSGRTNAIRYTLSTLNNSGVIAVTASIPEAEIFLNSLYQGKTPLIISNLSLGERYRLEITDPSTVTNSNRNSVYKQIVLTEESPSFNFDAKFKSYETRYRPPAQKALLAATYLSWFTTVGLIGGSVYANARVSEANGILSLNNISQAERDRQFAISQQFSVIAQGTLYSSIAFALISSGVMGWYLHSKNVYLGMDMNPAGNEWYAKLQINFNGNKKAKQHQKIIDVPSESDIQDQPKDKNTEKSKEKISIESQTNLIDPQPSLKIPPVNFFPISLFSTNTNF